MVESLRRAWSSWESDAALSACGKYRWWLSRNLGGKSRKLLFIGLNPSIANKTKDDPTMRRILTFGHSWGYSQLLVLNLFARISSSPSVLRRVSKPVGELNNDFLKLSLFEWSRNPELDLWLGWGASGHLQCRDLFVINYLNRLKGYRFDHYPNSLGPFALGRTLNGQPKHPLYVSNKTHKVIFDCSLPKKISNCS